MAVWKRTKKNQGPKKNARRKGALERLEKQLKSGKKPNKELCNPHLDYEDTLIDLTDGDVTRIKKQIEVIKTRI